MPEVEEITARLMNGNAPPPTLFPNWYDNDTQVHRRFAGKSLTRYAAMGPDTSATSAAWTNTSTTSATIIGLAAPFRTLKLPSDWFATGVSFTPPDDGLFS